MMRILCFVAFLAFLSGSCQKDAGARFFSDPEGALRVGFGLNADSTPYYLVYFQDSLVIDTSALGVVRGDAGFFEGMEVVEIDGPEKVEDAYRMLHGKRKDNKYVARRYTVHLRNREGNPMDIVFQLSNDGFAYRYAFPGGGEKPLKILEERSSYRFPANTLAWLQPMARAKTGWCEVNPSYEENYISGAPVDTEPEYGEGWVYPALFRVNDIWALITETGVDRNYCGTRLVYDEVSKAMRVTFPQKEEIFTGGGLLPESSLPWDTPWRVVVIGSLQTIVASALGTDLAAPAIDADTSFIRGGLASWSWGLLKDEFTNYETTREFIDYASRMNWPYFLVDADWDTRIGYDSIRALAAYAKAKNVKLWLWYNSSGDWNSTVYHPKSKLLTHEDRVKEFSLLRDMGIAGVKVDFFGGDGQSMIAYYHDIMKDAADHRLMANFHGATLPRGWSRTYPHLMSTEAVRGFEFVTFEQVNADRQPAHCALLPFTRNVFDPMDFTPMALDSIPNIRRVTTPAFELALPVLFLSGIQHIAEIPSGMSKMPDYVVDYLKDIPTLWDDSRLIGGDPGKEVIIARRKGETWHIVGINGETMAKGFELDLSFLKGRSGFIITDGEEGLFTKDKISVPESGVVRVNVIPYGGFVIKI